MKNIIMKLIKITFIINLISISAYANENVIGVSADIEITKLTKNELKNIFLGRKTLWDNGEPIRVGISLQNPEKLNKFLTNNIGQTQRRFKKYWLKKVFAGYGIAPKIFKDDKKALEFIGKHENSIIYISAEDMLTLKEVKTISIE
ncbi:MAG: ABC-type phosphate transport system substrate-binding protein [Sulfurimonas sp.]|jgi:ABC-type phosphate transport system substrate-binding protein|uniref:hypothetical protein n=1 Tax=Sulfurimonas sp. TaxID=2022749 RepID=UPI0039E36A95